MASRTVSTRSRYPCDARPPMTPSLHAAAISKEAREHNGVTGLPRLGPVALTLSRGVGAGSLYIRARARSTLTLSSSPQMRSAVAHSSGRPVGPNIANITGEELSTARSSALAHRPSACTVHGHVQRSPRPIESRVCRRKRFTSATRPTLPAQLLDHIIVRLNVGHDAHLSRDPYFAKSS